MPSERVRKGVFHQIFALAAQLEPNRPRVWHWLLNVPIPALDSLTAVELVYAGRGASVIHLLESACHLRQTGLSSTLTAAKAATAD
jgi:hypothetical protein